MWTMLWRGSPVRRAVALIGRSRRSDVDISPRRQRSTRNLDPGGPRENPRETT